MANFVNPNPASTTPGLRVVDGSDVAAVINFSNIPAAKYTANAASGAATAAAGDLTGAQDVFALYSAVGAANLTTRTAAQMLADFAGAVVGYAYSVTIANTSAGTTTLVGGTGVTITGTATIAASTTRQFIVTFTSATAATFQSVQTATIS